MKTKLMFGLGLAGLAALAVAMTMWSSQGDYKVLYANLSGRTAAPSSPSSRR